MKPTSAYGSFTVEVARFSYLNSPVQNCLLRDDKTF